MYLECILIGRNKSQADEETDIIIKRNQIKGYAQVYNNKQYRSTIRLNKKYLDSPLNKDQRYKNGTLKTSLNKWKFNSVFVSPLRADLETCFDIFGEHSGIQIYIDPSLAPRVNSIANANHDNTQLIEQFQSKPHSSKLTENPKWFLSFGQKLTNGDENIDQFQKYLQNQTEFQSSSHFLKRINDFKKGLFVYSNNKDEKIGIIAHPEVLEVLSSTGSHQDFTLINSSKVNFGQAKSQFIHIEGIEAEKQNNNLPFCSMCG